MRINKSAGRVTLNTTRRAEHLEPSSPDFYAVSGMAVGAQQLLDHITTHPDRLGNKSEREEKLRAFLHKVSLSVSDGYHRDEEGEGRYVGPSQQEKLILEGDEIALAAVALHHETCGL